jgi:hypothetical protein
MPAAILSKKLSLQLKRVGGRRIRMNIAPRRKGNLAAGYALSSREAYREATSLPSLSDCHTKGRTSPASSILPCANGFRNSADFKPPAAPGECTSNTSHAAIADEASLTRRPTRARSAATNRDDSIPRRPPAFLDAIRYLRDEGASMTPNCGHARGYSVLDVVKTVKRVSGVDFEGEAQRTPGRRPRSSGCARGPHPFSARLAAEI